MLIVRFQINALDIPISIDRILDKITARDSEESGVLILQLLQVSDFKGVYELVIEGFIRCVHILVDSTSFVTLKLDLFLYSCGRIGSYHGVYSQVGQAGPCRYREGCVERQFQNDANLTVMSSSLWCRKCCFVGI